MSPRVSVDYTFYTAILLCQLRPSFSANGVPIYNHSQLSILHQRRISSFASPIKLLGQLNKPLPGHVSLDTTFECRIQLDLSTFDRFQGVDCSPFLVKSNVLLWWFFYPSSRMLVGQIVKINWSNAVSDCCVMLTTSLSKIPACTRYNVSGVDEETYFW